MQKILRRVLICLFVTALLLIAGGPWALYGLGLYVAGGKPAPPIVIAQPAVQLAEWKKARGLGTPAIAALDPYTYFASVTTPGNDQAGALVAWRVASAYIYEHKRYKGMGWWHLSGAALTIWLTRNWSTEQLLTAAAHSSAGRHDQ